MEPFTLTLIKKTIITPYMLEIAKARDPGKAFNSKSFMDGKGTLVGNIGDEMVKIYRPDFIPESTYDYDFVHNHKGDRNTIDNKTKYQTVDNIDRIGEWMASVCKDSVHQKTDYYTFCRVYKIKDGNGFRYPFGWVLGIISKEEFFKKATYYNKGDQEGDNGYTVKQDCYSLPYNQLYHLPIFKKA